MYVKNSIFVFALFKKGKVFWWVNMFLNEFGYDSLNSCVEASLLAEKGK